MITNRTLPVKQFTISLSTVELNFNVFYLVGMPLKLTLWACVLMAILDDSDIPALFSSRLRPNRFPLTKQNICSIIRLKEYQPLIENLKGSMQHLRELSAFMHLEPAEDAGYQNLTKRQDEAIYTSRALLPNGKRIILLKTLLTSACERDCYYCPFRSGRNFKRTTLMPSEMARAFISLYRAGIVQGIFLSSGLHGSGIRTQDRLLATIEILREKYAYEGYVHLKLMPGAEHAQVERAMQLSDRVSLNLEAPNTKRLALLAPRKLFIEELLQPMRWVEDIRRSKPAQLGWKRRWPSLTTQFVVGAVNESDHELLAVTQALHQNLNLSRAYFSAFHPNSDTPFESLPPTPPTRQYRLYQASYLLRDYGFNMKDLLFSTNGNLPQDIDPKTAWANAHISEAPIELNRASRRDLLRIPGIGPKSAITIINARRRGRLRKIEDLHNIGLKPSRSLPYILLDGRRPNRQLSFW